MTKLNLLLELVGYKKLSKSNQIQIDKLIEQAIQKYKSGTDDAYTMIDRIYSKFRLDLNEYSETEIKNNLLMILKSEAGYCLKEDYIWNVGGQLAPLKETTITGADIVGKDSNLQGDIYKRVKSTDNLYRQEPKKRKYDEDEDEVIDKLKALLKLFNDRSKSKITMTSLKKILSNESMEQRFNIKSRLKAASALIEDSPECETELIKHYFTEGNILESSGGSSSSTSWSNWQDVSYIVYIDSSGRVKSSNSFLARVSERIDQQKLEYLLSKGITIISLDANGQETEIKNKPSWLKQ